MTCVLCGTRKAKRACPALGRSICPTCCGTKRQKEIACTADCVYLASAQAHPPAVVQRQRERDLPLLVQMIEGLTAAQGEALQHLQARIQAHRATAIPPIRDADVEQAVHALAATLETASRGILYEHQTASVPALRLQQDLRAALAEEGERERAPGTRPLGAAPMAAVLSRIETVLQRAARQPGASDTAFLDFLDRITRARGRHGGDAGGPEERGAAPEIVDPAGSRIIIP